MTDQIVAPIRSSSVQNTNRPLNGRRVTQYFWSFVLVFASIRGAFVYHLGLPVDTVYIMAKVLLLYFGLLSLRSMFVNNSVKELVLLRNAVKINYLLIGFLMLMYMLFLGLDRISMVYLFVVFPIIFTLIKYDSRLLHGVVFVIALVTVFGVLIIYNIGVSEGFDAFQDAHSILRDTFAYSRIGDNLLSFGYQASHHDAANILVMCGIFFLSNFMIELGFLKKYLYLSAYFLVVIAVLLTGSTANFVVLGAVSSLAILFYLKKHTYVTTMALIIFFSTLYQLLLLDSFNSILYFYEKLNYDQSALKGGGMFNSLDLNSILSSLHAILFGFGYVFKVPLMSSEVAFVKVLVEYGFIPFIVLMFICFSPLYYVYIFRRNIKSRAQVLRYHNSSFSTTQFISANQVLQHRLIIAAMPTLAGTLTLLHYGSLFRVTSIGLFCVLIALFFKEYLTLKKTMVNAL